MTTPRILRPVLCLVLAVAPMGLGVGSAVASTSSHGATLPAPRTLDAVIADVAVRGDAAVARDRFRNPAETLDFFGLNADLTVIEIAPGGGWYTDIIAPYIASGKGTYIAAHGDPAASTRSAEAVAAFKAKYTGRAGFGDVQYTAFGAKTGAIGPAQSADMVLTFRNVHNWVIQDYAPKAFADFYAVLKPGGVLGVVEHRLPEGRDSALEKSSGYMKTSSVIALAKAAGFELVATSEINANPKDTADHPFGVWTLPPVSRKSGPDGTTPAGFDPAVYLAIGESDRMTLKFRKPLTADAALLE